MENGSHVRGAIARGDQAARAARWRRVVSLGLATAFGFYHAPLVQGDLSAIGHGLIKSDLRFRERRVLDDLVGALGVASLSVVQARPPDAGGADGPVAGCRDAHLVRRRAQLRRSSMATERRPCGRGYRQRAAGGAWDAIPPHAHARRAGGRDLLGAVAAAVRLARHTFAVSTPGAWHSSHHRGPGVCCAQCNSLLLAGQRIVLYERVTCWRAPLPSFRSCCGS